MGNNPLATALIACHHYLIAKQTRGRRQLFEAVNEAFCVLWKGF